MRKIFAVLLMLLLVLTAIPAVAAADSAQDPLELLAMQSPYGVREVSMGSSHTVAILDDGSLWAWGINFNGQLGTGQYETVWWQHSIHGSVPVRVGIDSNTSVRIGIGTNLGKRGSRKW